MNDHTRSRRMHPTVSTVATKEAQREMERAGGRVVPYAVAESAINAALAALAPDIRAAVDLLIRRVRLEKAAQAGSDERWKAEMGRLVMEARRDLFTLLGIEDAE